MTEEQPKPFEDISIFQGVCQYFDEQGDEWRRENDGTNCYTFWKKQGDSFVYQRSLRTRSKKTEDLHNEFITIQGQLNDYN